MKDKNGIEITLGIIVRYLDMTLNDKIFQSLHIDRIEITYYQRNNLM